MTYVDFVSIPVALQLDTTDGQPRQNVLGLPANGLDAVCDQLRLQASRQPGAGWDKLIIPSPSGGNLRAISPNNGIILNSALFRDYWQPYVERVWDLYGPGGRTLTINSQVAWGAFQGFVATDDTLVFPEAPGYFPQPTARDVFSCSTGAFGDYEGDDETVAIMSNLGARLAAAFNRSTLLLNDQQPEGERVETYYREAITNHYSRILHMLNLDGRGYAFPYDDVAPAGTFGEKDQMGAVASEKPGVFTVLIGGGMGTSRVTQPERTQRNRQQMVAGRRSGPRLVRRGLSDWSAVGEEEDEGPPVPPQRKQRPAAVDADTLEKGEAAPAKGEPAPLDLARRTDVSETTAAWVRRLRELVPGPALARAEALFARVAQSPLFLRLQPFVAVVFRLAVALMSLPLKTLVNRVCATVFLVIFYLVFGPLGRTEAHDVVGSSAGS